MMRTPAIALTTLLLLSACMKEELPVPAAPRGDARELQVCMGPGYQQQVWMSLASGEVVSSNPKTAWELSFEGAPDGWRIMLNGSRLMMAWNIGNVDITQPTDTAGMSQAMRIDAPSGDPDSTAFGDWRGSGNVYVVDLGYNALGQQLGFRKVRPVSVSAAAYTFQVAQLNGSALQTVSVAKDPQRSQVHYSFANGVVAIAPPDGAWDLVFTQYTHQFYVPFLPYIVSGVLIDGSTTRVARIPGASFEAVTLADTLQYPMTRKRDAIGYDWKAYSFETSSYTVDAGLVYILQDAQGFFHKLHFLDFYNDMGQVGCPRFAVKPL
jgi:hypothetical protein